MSFFSAQDVDAVKNRSHGQGQLFMEDISRLQAKGGGDCPEPIYRGMCDAMTKWKDPPFGSPLFVFTDAPPKDEPGKADLTGVVMIATDREIPVNFFIVKKICESYTIQSYEPYHDIADMTGGNVFNLPSTALIKQMKG